MDSFDVICWLIIIGGAYLFPTTVAGWRHHRNGLAIAALNILLGWTLLGWVASLVWALTSDRERTSH